MAEGNAPLIRIVDDEKPVLDALQLMLEVEGWRVSAYGSASDFLKDLDSRTPGCILLDVRMPGLSGPELQRILKERNSLLPIVFITSYAEIDVAISTLKSGAFDFLLKPVDPEKLLEVIGSAVRQSRLRLGGVVLPENLPEVCAGISEQPRKVLRFMLEGMNDAAIANRMGLSVRTVQVYRSGIYKTFSVHSVKQFSLLAPYIREALAPEG